MNNLSRDSFDPLNHVAPYELLEEANRLIKNGQVAEYWENVPLPYPPIGKVPFEVTRQIATFAIPFVGLVYCYWTYDLKTVLFGIPVAWLVGFLLHKQLTSAIRWKRLRDEGIDRGRYMAVNTLAEKMSIRPEAVTLAMIHKMNSDYEIVTRIIEEKVREAKDKKSASKLHRVKSVDDDVSSDSSTTRGHRETYSHYDDESYDFSPTVNCANGLPMIQGTQIDVHGNSYGTNWN